MHVEPSISYLDDVAPSLELEADVRRHLDALERYYDRITACRVVISCPHRRHRQGRLFNVRIDLTVPNEALVVNREAGLDHAHENVRVALHDAFRAARRKLQDHVRLARGFVKTRQAVTTPAEEDFPPLPASAPLLAPEEHGSWEVELELGGLRLQGTLVIPESASALVLFAHGSGSSRHSSRNVYVAGVLNSARIATLLFDLLSEDEARRRENVFDVSLLARRLSSATRWVESDSRSGGLRLGYFGASTGAAAAISAAADDLAIGAIVSRGGRPDLAWEDLPFVAAPTLLVVGGEDPQVLELNRQAYERLHCPKELTVVPGAGHIFEEPGTLAEAARQAREWFLRYLAPPS